MFDMDAAYREYAVMVYKFLLSLCYEEELAEELTQETFYQAVRSVDGMMEAAKCLHGCARLPSISGIGRWNAEKEKVPVN